MMLLLSSLKFKILESFLYFSYFSPGEKVECQQFPQFSIFYYFRYPFLFCILAITCYRKTASATTVRYEGVHGKSSRRLILANVFDLFLLFPEGHNLEPAGEDVGELDHVPVGEVEGLKPGDGCLREVSATVVPQRQANLLLSETQCQSK